MQIALESARGVVVDEGITALSARKVAKVMGYTIGTLYQHFEGMDDLVERMNAQTLAALYAHCKKGAGRGETAAQLKALGILFTEFMQAHRNEWDAIMSYRYKDEHETSQDYHLQILRLFGLMEAATAHFYTEDEREKQASDMALLWACLTGIWGVASSERNVGGSLEQMIEQLIDMFLKARD
ncbi:MAG: TetR/AcrR family transcriptional regulator [Paracoccaceae bacterium]